jgi:Protein of unknown function (DUF3108)
MLRHGRKHFVIIALILSILSHTIVLAPLVLNMSWQEIIETLREKISQFIDPEAPDQVLSRKKADFVPRVSLNSDVTTDLNDKRSLPKIVTIRLIKEQSIMPKIKPIQAAVKISNRQKSSQNQSQSSDDLYTELMTTPTRAPNATDDQYEGLDDPIPPYDLDQNTLIDNTTVRIEPQPTALLSGVPAASLVATGSQIAEPTAKSSPPFPTKIYARYRTTVLGFSLDVYRQWHMEGRRYSIVDSTNLFGVKASMTSEGSITQRGLEPDHFKILWDANIYRFAKFNRDNMVMTYGRPSNPKQISFNSNIQDISSIGFQMALAYESQDIQITAGTSIYPIRLELVGEEQLKLPVGVVRTLHIQGRSTGGVDATADIWLAPDYRNMPVKIKVSSGNQTLVQSLSSLAFEGKVIFGKKYLPADAANDEASQLEEKNQLPQGLQLPDEF